ncbi:MAG: exodeoxyribonuclease VII small subunit [Enterovibrio sp.]
MGKRAAKKRTFEEIMSELETIIQTLEAGDLPLESALQQFEDGIMLVKSGQKTLADAEQKVSILLCDDDNSPLAPFVLGNQSHE